MLDLIPAIVGTLSFIVGITLLIRTLRRRPSISFQLLRRTEVTRASGKYKEKIALLSAPCANKVRRFLGDTAKKTSVNVLYEAQSQGGKKGAIQVTSPLFEEKLLELILLRIFKSNHFYDQQVLISNSSDDFRFLYKSPMTKGVA